VQRTVADPIQIDGELAEAGRDIRITVRPNAIRILVPTLPPDEKA